MRLLFLLLLLSFLPAPPAYTQDALLEPYLASAPDIRSQAALLIDAATGTVLFEKEADAEISPASLTKLMTMHVAFREAAAQGVSLDDPVAITSEAWAVNQPPRSSLMFLAPGQTVTLRELFLGLAISSGNDAAVAVALRFAPNVADFVTMMNNEAVRMGLEKTRFTEPSGVSEYNMTTAREFTVFCREYLRMYPRALKDFHSVPEFAYPKRGNVGAAFREKPGTIVQYNHNRLAGVVPGVDGLKTGYIDEAGYNIALTAEREGTRFLAVILGAPARPGGDRIRDADGTALLSWAFQRFKTIRPPGLTVAPVQLWKGRENFAELLPADAFPFTAPVERGKGLRYTAEIADPLIAPLARGQEAGSLIIWDDHGELRRIPLLAAADYERGNIFKRFWDAVRLFFGKLSH